MKKLTFVLMWLASTCLIFAIDPTFSGRVFGTITVDTSFSLSMSASAWGVPLSGGETVCLGSIAVSPSVGGSYSNVRGAKVECPEFECYPLSGESTSNLPITSVSSSTYSSVFNNYWGCKYYDSGAPYNGYATNTIRAEYWTSSPLEKVADGAVRNGVFCYGTKQLYVNTNAIGGASRSFEDNSQIPYTPPSRGTYSLFTHLSIDGCAMMVRSFETGGQTYDCSYSGSVGYATNSPSISNLNVINGPLLSATTPLIIAPAIPNGPTTFSFTVTNTGDMDASITAMSLDQGFTVTSSNLPLTVSRDGGTAVITGTATAPPSEGTYIVRAYITWNAITAITIIGSCGASAGAGTPIAVTSAPGAIVASNLSSYFNQLDLKVVVDPTGIIQDRNHWITVNVSASRGEQEIYLDDINITISRWNNESDPPSWEYAAGWNPTNQNICDFNSWSDNIYLQYFNGDYAYGFASDRYRVHYLSPNTCTSIGNDWPIGVYRVTVSTSDSSIIPNRQNYNISKYFVIYNLPCLDR